MVLNTAAGQMVKCSGLLLACRGECDKCLLLWKGVMGSDEVEEKAPLPLPI